MEATFEAQVTALFGQAMRGDAVPREVYRRLQFLARVLGEAPASAGTEVRLLWLDAAGKLAWVKLDGAEIVIGREAACDVVLAGAQVSRRHCVIRRMADGSGGVELQDLGASNGTLVNGQQLPGRGRKELRDGDVIEAGGVPVAVAMPGPGVGPPAGAQRTPGEAGGRRSRDDLL